MFLELCMPRYFATIFCLFAMILVASPVLSQDTEDKGKKEEKPKVKPLPDDRRLMTLHFDFVKKAEKLANE